MLGIYSESISEKVRIILLNIWEEKKIGKKKKLCLTCSSVIKFPAKIFRIELDNISMITATKYLYISADSGTQSNGKKHFKWS